MANKTSLLACCMSCEDVTALSLCRCSRDWRQLCSMPCVSLLVAPSLLVALCEDTLVKHSLSWQRYLINAL